MNEQEVEEFLKKKIFAVVGVSKNREKYGTKVYFDLDGAGYEVYAINPKLKSISGKKVFPSLKNLPVKPEVVVFVVPPKIGIEVIKEVNALGIWGVWLQPGAESKEIIDFCKKEKIKCIHDLCIMIQNG